MTTVVLRPQLPELKTTLGDVLMLGKCFGVKPSDLVRDDVLFWTFVRFLSEAWS